LVVSATGQHVWPARRFARRPKPKRPPD